MHLRRRHILPMALAGMLSHAAGAEFLAYRPNDNGTPRVIFIMNGSINLGDTHKLYKAAVPFIGEKLNRIMVLSSPGGRLMEAVEMARLVSVMGADTYVSGNCDSACFVVFAAGKTKYVEDDAELGVHAASLGDKQNNDGTVLQANILERLHVPYDVIGRMVTTPSDKGYVLTLSDIAEMGANVVPSIKSITRRLGVTQR
jgi:hypothetical protein